MTTSGVMAEKSGLNKNLKVLFKSPTNDEYNEMSYVMHCLQSTLPLCNSLRAEQLVTIVHNTGECLIYSSLNPAIYVMYAQLQKLGLQADIRYSKTKY